MAWGQRVLSPGEPFTEGSKKDEDVERIMVVLTDGDNAIEMWDNDRNTKKSAYSSFGYVTETRLGISSTSPEPIASQVQTRMDELTSAACESAKAAGQEIYTIRLQVNSATSSSLLRNCATDREHYFDAPTPEKLQPVFDEIANRIKQLHISS